MTTNSNTRGRALEYCICAEIARRFPSSSFSDHAAADNRRDKPLFDGLSPDLKSDFSKCASIVAQWLVGKLERSDAEFEIDRLPDRGGIAGDPTDIRIGVEGGGIINLSIKNRKPSFKHQRLTRLPEQCGITNHKIASKYTSEHDRIWDGFYSLIKQKRPDARLYKDVDDLTFKHLYQPFVRLVIHFLNSNKSSAPKFFKFLKGKVNYYMVENAEDEVRIYDLFNPRVPATMSAKRINDNNISLEFDNGWRMNLRIHTASKRLYTAQGKPNRSVKMDTTVPDLETFSHEIFRK